jgi:hypothetical protein
MTVNAAQYGSESEKWEINLNFNQAPATKLGELCPMTVNATQYRSESKKWKINLNFNQAPATKLSELCRKVLPTTSKISAPGLTMTHCEYRYNM